MNLDDLPDEPLERLAAYQKGMDEERERVKEALAKLPVDRTRADWEWIGYSQWGTASGCSCGGGR